MNFMTIFFSNCCIVCGSCVSAENNTILQNIVLNIKSLLFLDLYFENDTSNCCTSFNWLWNCYLTFCCDKFISRNEKSGYIQELLGEWELGLKITFYSFQMRNHLVLLFCIILTFQFVWL